MTRVCHAQLHGPLINFSMCAPRVAGSKLRDIIGLRRDAGTRCRIPGESREIRDGWQLWRVCAWWSVGPCASWLLHSRKMRMSLSLLVYSLQCTCLYIHKRMHGYVYASGLQYMVIIVHYHSSQYRRTALHYASGGGHHDTVRVLLERGADPKTHDEVSCV